MTADPDFCAKSANNSSPDPHVGLPSEEAIARAMRPAVWARCDAAGVTSESTGSGVTLGDLAARATSLLDANTLLSLIRPAFEAKDAEIERLKDENASLVDERAEAITVALSAEARLAQAVKALDTAAEDIEHWGSYASSYLQDKHGLKDDIAACRTASAAARGET